MALPQGEARVASGVTTERRSLAAVADIVVEWQRLAARAAEPNIFYDPAFALAATTEAPSSLGADVEAIIVWSSGPTRRVIGLFPFRIARRRFLARLPIIVGWIDAFAPLGTPLVDSDAGTQAMRAFLDHVAADPALPKLLLLPLLNEGGPVAAMLAAALRQRGGALRPFDRHRRALVEPGHARAGYIERALGGKRRKELRRQRRRLADESTLHFDMVTSGADVSAALQQFLMLEAGGWKGRAGTAMVQQPEIRRFVEMAIDALAMRGEVRIARLSRGSDLIASAIVLTSSARGAAWAWKTAYDERFARSSPGVQLFIDITEALLADQMILMADSCAVADHPMIDHLWSERLQVADWLIAATGAPSFEIACRLEGFRRRAVTAARTARDSIRRIAQSGSWRHDNSTK